MQQPIYWPDKLLNDPRTYQKAYDSLQLKSSQGDHPDDDIDEIFGKGMKLLSNSKLIVKTSLHACEYGKPTS